MAEQDFDSLKGLEFDSTSTYTLVEEIGRGGMGIVFLAEKHAEGVTDYVVLKTLKTFSPEYIAMLKKEANIATGLRHENIVKTYGLEAVPYGDLPATFTGAVQGVSFEQAHRNLHVRRLAGMGVDEAAAKDSSLAAGLNVRGGEITYAAVNEAFGW
jgi:serine/threonine protein kinase